MSSIKFVIDKSPRIQRLIDHLYENMPQIEADRAELITESYKATEGFDGKVGCPHIYYS